MNILLVPYSHQLGSTHVLISIGKFLKSIGHNVWIGGNGKYMYLADQNGLDRVELVEIPIETYRQKTDHGDMSYLSVEEIREFVNEEVKLYKELNIELVISTLRPSCSLSAKVSGIKHIALTYSFLTPYFKFLIKTPESHVLYNIAKLPVIGLLFNLLCVKPIYSHLKKQWAKNYNIVARELMVKGFADLYDAYCGDITWLFDIEEFAPLKSNSPKTLKFLGHVFNSVTGSVPEWIGKVKTLKNEAHKDVILLSMGSSGTKFPRILKDLVEYCTKNDKVLMSTSCNHLISERYTDFDNIFLTDFADMKSLLEVTDIAIIHGGRGTIYDALTMNRPSIVIPHQAEQETNSERIQELGLGYKLSLYNYKREDLYKTLDEYFNNKEKVQKNVDRFVKNFEKYDWKKVVEDTIAEL